MPTTAVHTAPGQHVPSSPSPENCRLLKRTQRTSLKLQFSGQQKHWAQGSVVPQWPWSAASVDRGLLANGEAIYRLLLSHTYIRQEDYKQTGSQLHRHRVKRSSELLLEQRGFPFPPRKPQTARADARPRPRLQQQQQETAPSDDDHKLLLSPAATTDHGGTCNPLRHLYWHTIFKPVRFLGARE